MRVHGERGSLTLWMLGLCVMILFLGGISLDLWRAFGARARLAGESDAAAIAGASGIDEEYFRATGEVRLDPARAEALAWERVAGQPDARRVRAQVGADTGRVVVHETTTVDFTLLKVFLAGEPFTVTVESSASPVRSE